ncbi:MAG: hypothetical protein EVB11_05120 [Winogradskyella sp.]|nr:MAG: hypothetical protein EVB11_05120 [Winogradskyella sp.]
MKLTKTTIDQLIVCDQVFHNWGRIVGTIGELFVPPKPDDSHTNFFYNHNTKQIEGRQFETPNGNLFIAFDVVENAFHFYSVASGKIKATIEATQSYFHIISGIQKVLVANGIASSSCPEVVEFRFPQHFDEDGISKSIDSKSKTMWMQLRDGANRILSEITQELTIESEIRIWKTNFDTGIFHNDNKGLNQWAGLASADDEVIDVPYFYNSMVYKGAVVKPIDLKPLKNGYWEHINWNGAVLPITEFNTIEDYLTIAKPFLLESTKGLLNKLKQ